MGDFNARTSTFYDCIKDDNCKDIDIFQNILTDENYVNRNSQDVKMTRIYGKKLIELYFIRYDNC